MTSDKQTGPVPPYRAGSEAVEETAASLPLGPDRLLVGGEWVDVSARVDWRDRMNLADADPHEIYAAGMRDGFDLAVSQLKEFASLLADRLALDQAFERAQRQVRRSA